jgi:hypothetical protein
MMLTKLIATLASRQIPETVRVTIKSQRTPLTKPSIMVGSARSQPASDH